MQKLKKQKIQEILDKQNAAVDADMVCSTSIGIVIRAFSVLFVDNVMTIFFETLMGRTTKGKGV